MRYKKFNFITKRMYDGQPFLVMNNKIKKIDPILDDGKIRIRAFKLKYMRDINMFYAYDGELWYPSFVELNRIISDDVYLLLEQEFEEMMKGGL